MVDYLLVETSQLQGVHDGRPKLGSVPLSLAAASCSASAERQRARKGCSLGRETGAHSLGAAELATPEVPQQQLPQPQAWSQRFSDDRLEQRFRLYQARMLHPVRALGFIWVVDSKP